MWTSVIMVQNIGTCEAWTFAPQMPMQTLENLDVGIRSNRCIRWNNMSIDNTILNEEHTEPDFGG